MSPEIYTNLRTLLTSLAVLALFIGSAFLLRLFLLRIVHLFTKKTRTILDDLIVQGITTPLFWALIIGGLWVSLTLATNFNVVYPVIHKIFVSFYILIGGFTLSRIINAILTCYAVEAATRTRSHLDTKLVPLMRRIITFIVFVIASLFIIQQFTAITPLLTALGIGGLAVALALQPTLTNFLAGTYVMSDAIIHTGDYVMLDSGQEGFVEDIGWRTTTLRHWQGNLIIMPNSKLSDAVITDYERPDKSFIFTLDCGVSYDSDLEKVERITLEVATEILTTYPEGDKDFTPAVRFKQFGDSNINFAVVLKSVDRAGHFIIKHQFIKALNSRFQKEGVEIQYPVRKLLFANSPDIQKESRK